MSNILKKLHSGRVNTSAFTVSMARTHARGCIEADRGLEAPLRPILDTGITDHAILSCVADKCYSEAIDLVLNRELN
jgi:hypothetical protein